MRCHYEKAKKFIVATAILHNLAIMLDEEEPDGEDVYELPGDEEYLIIEDHAEAEAVRYLVTTVKSFRYKKMKGQILCRYRYL
jgi:hypothetical protein